MKYTEVHCFKISKVQKQTFKKMKSYKINVSKFIREAVSEKLKRDHQDLLPKPKKEFCPFSNGTIEIKHE